MALPRRTAWWFLLAAGLAPYAHGQAVCSTTPQRTNVNESFTDEGLAYQACVDANTDYVAQLSSTTYIDYKFQACERPWPTAKEFHARYTAQGLNPFQSCAPQGQPYDVTRQVWSFNDSCATRPISTFTWSNADHSGVCSNGCAYSFTLKTCAWGGPEGNREYACAADGTPNGATCTGTGYNGTTAPPPDPDPDGPPDGPNEPDPPDPDPPDPDPPDPDPPDPDEPDPPEPDDGNDDGQQVVGQLGPKLDAIKASIDQIPPRLDTINASIQSAASQANSNAQSIVNAIEGLELGSGGGGEGGEGGEGGSVLGGETCTAPPVCTGDAIQCAIVVQAYQTRCGTEALAQNLATFNAPPGTEPDEGEIWADAEPFDVSTLDDSGFGWSRSCPAFPSVTVMGHTFSPDPNGDACDLLSMLAALILLAGYVQAGFIVASRGNA